MQVVDGVQRISAIYDFAKNKFALSGLEYLQNELRDLTFEKIVKSLWGRRFLQTGFIANVIDPQTPDDVKFDIFRRLNTGGTPLNAQEIRHCISKPRTRNFLARLNDNGAFHKATRNRLMNHARMVDRELALRFCAFRLLSDISDYAGMNGMDDLLTKTVRKLDFSHTTSDDMLDKLDADFSRSMENSWLLFGDHAFCKWHLDNEYLSPINRALFDVWSVVLADYQTEQLLEHKTTIVQKARDMMTNDIDFINSISWRTSQASQLFTRFNKVRECVREICE
ncbi:MAG: DUF262 domain-containing protein [Magnetococcales bacterium]|nr:DUF262 domain-containing protein [Magnetococcales bacterium]